MKYLCILFLLITTPVYAGVNLGFDNAMVNRVIKMPDFENVAESFKWAHRYNMNYRAILKIEGVQRAKREAYEKTDTYSKDKDRLKRHLELIKQMVEVMKDDKIQGSIVATSVKTVGPARKATPEEIKYYEGLKKSIQGVKEWKK